MTREFIYLQIFDKNWGKLGLTDSDLLLLEDELIKNPQAGKIIEGTGGLRKLRFALPNTGKSSGVRILYVDFASYEKLFFVNVYGKSQQESLTAEQKAVLKQAVKALEDGLRKG